MVSSTDSVVCDSQTTLYSSRTVTTGDVLGAVHQVDAVRRLAHGADDLLVALVADEQDVVVLAREALTASLWTLVTSGQVASMEASRRPAASSWTTGATPCAEKMTMAPSGTSCVSSTKIAPFFSRVWTTYLLWTICLRT